MWRRGGGGNGGLEGAKDLCWHEQLAQWIKPSLVCLYASDRDCVVKPADDITAPKSVDVDNVTAETLDE